MYKSEAWVNIYTKGLKIIGIFNKSNSLIGSFNLYFGNKLGQQYIITPPYATDIGLWYEDSSTTVFQKNKLAKNILSSITNYLDSLKVIFIDIVLPIHIKDVQPFLWANFECTSKFTYILDIEQSEEVMMQNMSPERRKNIKDGQKNVESFHCDDFNLAYNRTIISLSENNASFNEGIVKKLITQFPKKDNHICIGTKIEKELSSIHFITSDTKNANYIFGWNDKKSSSIAGTFGLWSCILEAKTRGLKTFNFAGSAIPSIEKYFRGFGGELVSSFQIKKQNTIGKVLLKVKK